MNPFYIVSLLRGAAIGFYAPIWILFLYNSNYSLFIIGVIGTLFEIMKLIFEVPSGAIADKFGIRKNLIYSALCLTLTWLLFSLTTNIIILIFILITWTLSETLFSGTFEAWVSNKVDKNTFSKIMFNNTKLSISAIIVISPFSGFLYKMCQFMPFVLAGIVSLILMIYLYLTVSESNENERRETYHKSIINVIIESIRVITRNKRALHIVAASFFFALVIDNIDRYWQPYFQYIKIPEVLFGFILTSGGLVLLIILHIFSKFNDGFNKFPEKYVIITTIVTIVLIILLAVGKKLIALFSVSLLTIVDDLINTLVNNILNQEISDTSKSMATIFSLNGAAGAMGEILSGIIFGFIITQLGYKLTFIICSIVLVVPLILYLKNTLLFSKKV